MMWMDQCEIKKKMMDLPYLFRWDFSLKHDGFV